MTDDEAIQAMTISLRSVSETIESIEKSETMKNLESMEQTADVATCPICLFAYNAISTDLETLRELRTMIIQNSSSSDNDEKLVAAAIARTAADETFKRCGMLIAFMEVAHSAIIDIVRARIEMNFLDENMSIEEMIRRVLENHNFSMPPTHFDPKKVN